MNSLVYDKNKEFLNPRIAIIAKSGSGKSWVIRDILNYIKDIPCGTIIAPTDTMNGFYNDFFPQSFIHHKYHEDIIPNLLKRQVIILRKNEERIKNGKKPIDPRAFLIMDDCMSTKHLWKKDPNILKIFNEGRHYQLTFIISMQYSLGLEPELRSNLDYVFLLGEDFRKNKDRLYDHYCGMFDTKHLFNQVFMQVTDDYGTMVINNRLRTNDINKKIFWYKAKNRKDFKVGCKQFEKYNNRFYDKNYDKRIPYIDLNNYDSKKNKILVRKV